MEQISYYYTVKEVSRNPEGAIIGTPLRMHGSGYLTDILQDLADRIDGSEKEFAIQIRQMTEDDYENLKNKGYNKV
jgi:hypothetical protein